MTNHADKQTLLSVIVPVYNEAQTIREILAQVRAVDLGPQVTREIIIVDDCSTDGTSAALAAEEAVPGTFVIRHPESGQGRCCAHRVGGGAGRYPAHPGCRPGI